MIYNEAQLTSFASVPFKYETDQIIATHDAIRKSIHDNLDIEDIKRTFDLSSFTYETYLQGSYKNTTNISKSSDVDIVVELTSVFYPDISSLNAPQQQAYNQQRSPSAYSFENFKNDIHRALVKSFGNNVIHRGHKVIIFDEHGRYCKADVLPCFTFKKFMSFESNANNNFRKGIKFITDGGQTVINYPKQHYDALTSKSRNTSGGFKETVRMFKNFREELIDHGRLNPGLPKSYFIENLLFNIPDNLFTGSYRDRLINICGRLVDDYNQDRVSTMMCANGYDYLLSDATWNKQSLHQFLSEVLFIRNNNSF